MYFGLINYILKKALWFPDPHKKAYELFKLGLPDNSHPANDNDNDDEDNENIILNKRNKDSFLKKSKNSVNENIINNNIEDYPIKERGSKQINSYNKNEKNNMDDELKQMPFLKAPANIYKCHQSGERDKKKEIDRNKVDEKKRCGNMSKSFIALLIFLFLTIIIFSSINIPLIKYRDWKIDGKVEDDKYNKFDKLNEKLLLEDFISNPILNCIFLFDIELVVLFIQWGFLILRINGAFFFTFFEHDYWSFFTNCYFSLLMVFNPIILFIFYESETVVKLNELNIFLYYFINLFFIFLVTTIVYIGIELPLKKLLKRCVTPKKPILNEIEEIDDDKMGEILEA
jgi:hypothetical protein